MLKNNYLKLLKELNRDQHLQSQNLYVPGKYWNNKAKKISYELQKKGLDNFRGYYSGVGTSYCDNIVIDIWNEEISKINNILRYTLRKIPILNRVETLIKKTQSMLVEMHRHKLKFYQHFLQLSARLQTLLDTYQIENTTTFGCVDLINVGQKNYSLHYLELLNTISFISEKIDFTSIISMLEIGGGFGANVHLMLQNYKNLKKIIYLDITPNLVVGTEYLRNLYGNCVIDYLTTKNLKKIRFANNNFLEIYCIAPWQIEKLEVTIDYFHNAHSFVEMPIEVVRNYLYYVEKFLGEKGRIGLVSYDGFDVNTTFSPTQLSSFIKKNLNQYEHPSLINPDRINYYFIG
jgi:putative sugar O-methyltransferase